jgi:hypothetical protein
MADHVFVKLKWEIAYHDPAACALMHNPNPAACKLVGGIYYDSPDWHQAGCYEPSVLAGWYRKSPIDEKEIDWIKYMATDACVCRRSQADDKIADDDDS